MEAKNAGVIMEVVELAVTDAVSHLVLPIACEFASTIVVARVSRSYTSMIDPARIN